MKILKDYFLVVVGSFFMGLGIAFTKCAKLGLSTISSVPNVLSIRLTFFTLGTWSTIWNLIMILAQVVILRRKFKAEQLMQIPVSIIFGWFTDFGVWALSFIPTDLYIVKLSMTVFGIILLAFGISVTVIADRVLNPAEAIVQVVSDKINCEFSNLKIIFDVFCVALATTLSLIFFNFKIVGIREGTIIAMLGTGALIKVFVKLLKRKNDKI